MVQRHGAGFGLDPFGLGSLLYFDDAYIVIVMLGIIDAVILSCVAY